MSFLAAKSSKKDFKKWIKTLDDESLSSSAEEDILIDHEKGNCKEIIEFWCPNQSSN